MITKSLVAAAAIASTMAVALPASQAQAGVDINIKIGAGGFGPGFHYGHGYFGPYHISCAKGRNIVDKSGFNFVRPIDCKLPGYRYVAWKAGKKYVVSVNRFGGIYKVNKI
jgi:hypothetical protein